MGRQQDREKEQGYKEGSKAVRKKRPQSVCNLGMFILAGIRRKGPGMRRVQRTLNLRSNAKNLHPSASLVRLHLDSNTLSQ